VPQASHDGLTHLSCQNLPLSFWCLWHFCWEGQNRDATRFSFHLLPPLNPRGMKHMLFLINHCDQSYGCTANQWSESLWKSSLSQLCQPMIMWSVMPKARQNIKALEAVVCQFSVLIKPKQEAQWISSNKAALPFMIGIMFYLKRCSTAVFQKIESCHYLLTLISLFLLWNRKWDAVMNVLVALFFTITVTETEAFKLQ